MTYDTYISVAHLSCTRRVCSYVPQEDICQDGSAGTKVTIGPIDNIHVNVGVAINGGTKKWMVCKGKSSLNG